MNRDATTRARLTKRRCRYCRREYRAPLGSRPHACPECAPTILGAIEEAERHARLDEAAASGHGHEGIPF